MTIVIIWDVCIALKINRSNVKKRKVFIMLRFWFFSYMKFHFISEYSTYYVDRISPLCIVNSNILILYSFACNVNNYDFFSLLAAVNAILCHYTINSNKQANKIDFNYASIMNFVVVLNISVKNCKRHKDLNIYNRNRRLTREMCAHTAHNRLTYFFVM